MSWSVFVRSTRIRGTRRRTAIAHGEARDGRFLRRAIPVEMFRDGPLLEAARRMLKDPKIDRVSLSRNWASSAHDDGANASARSHVIFFGSWTGGKLLVQGRADPICEMRKWHHYDPAMKHMVTKIA